MTWVLLRYGDWIHCYVGVWRVLWDHMTPIPDANRLGLPCRHIYSSPMECIGMKPMEMP